MEDSSLLIALAGGLVLAFIAGWFFASIRYRGEISGLRDTLETTRHNILDQLPQAVESSLNAITADALSRNNKAFLDLANERLHRSHSQAEASLSQRERAFDAMLDPIRDSLEATRRELKLLEQDRISSRSSLNQHLQDLVQSQRLLQQETQSLAQALRRPEVRGRWGELTLRRLVELSGLSEHCDFSEQVTVNTENGIQKPDLVINLPGDRVVVVDAKTPLDAFLSAASASNDQERDAALSRHADLLESRIRELSSKRYWEAFESSLDFVIVFLPGDQFLSAALEQNPRLLDTSLSKRVIPATPTSLIALLRALAAGWRQQQLSANATELARSGDEILNTLTRMNTHIKTLGRAIDTSSREFRRLTAMYDADVLPAADKLQKLGLLNKQAEIEPTEIEPTEIEPTEIQMENTVRESESNSDDHREPRS